MLEVQTSKTRKLAGVWLPTGVMWEQEYQTIQLSFESEYTTGGRGTIWEQVLTGLQPITLDFSEAWLNQEMVYELQRLARVSVSNYTLLWDGTTFLVSFVPTEFKINFVEGARKVKNIEDCPYTGTIGLTTR